MGPRSRERGDQNGEAQIHVGDGATLQWGRARVSAETTGAAGRKACIDEELQWGRARVGAETFTPSATDTAIASLQWGRARVSAETRPRATAAGSFVMRFNGAALA